MFLLEAGSEFGPFAKRIRDVRKAEKNDSNDEAVLDSYDASDNDGPHLLYRAGHP